MTLTRLQAVSSKHSEQPSPPALAVSAEGVARVLAIAAVALCAIDWLAKLLIQEGWIRIPRKLKIIEVVLGRFDVDVEGTIPTFYSSLLLVSAAVLFFTIAVVRRRTAQRQVWQWFAASGLMLFLAVDEATEFHELVLDHIPRDVIRAFGNDPDSLGAYYAIFPYAWVLPGFVLVVVVGLLFLPWVLSLPPVTRNLFIAAGAIFVAGALGMEFVASRYASRDTLGYRTLASIEELMEMLGVVLLIYAQLHYLRMIAPTLTLHLAKREGVLRTPGAPGEEASATPL